MLQINNLTKFRIDTKSFAQVAKKVLISENKRTLACRQAGKTISLAFVSKEEIKKLNKKYRGKNKPTDVLSFDLKEKNYLGEVVICPEVVKEKKEDIIKIFIHGILHLCGYNHEKNSDAEKMEAKEQCYLKFKI